MEAGKLSSYRKLDFGQLQQSIGESSALCSKQCQQACAAPRCLQVCLFQWYQNPGYFLNWRQRKYLSILVIPVEGYKHPWAQKEELFLTQRSRDAMLNPIRSTPNQPKLKMPLRNITP